MQKGFDQNKGSRRSILLAGLPKVSLLLIILMSTFILTLLVSESQAVVFTVFCGSKWGMTCGWNAAGACECISNQCTPSFSCGGFGACNAFVGGQWWQYQTCSYTSCKTGTFVRSRACTPPAPENNPPSAILTAITSTTGPSPLTVKFSGSCNDPDSHNQNKLQSCVIDFGDGSPRTWPVPGGSHTYTISGTYNVKLTATDASGVSVVSKSIPVDVSVPDNKPTVSLKINLQPGTSLSDVGRAPLDVEFEAECVDTDGLIVSCVLEFGDGRSSSVRDLKVTTTSSVSTTPVRDRRARSKLLGRGFATSASSASASLYSPVPTIRTPGYYSADILDQGQAPDLYGDYSWFFGINCYTRGGPYNFCDIDYGDGQTERLDTNAPQYGIGKKVHTYSKAGTYTVIVSSGGSQGSSGSAAITITVPEKTIEPSVVSGTGTHYFKWSGQKKAVLTAIDDNGGTTHLNVFFTIKGPKIIECGQTLTEDTTLTRGMSCPATALIIGASGITLDCNGNTITYHTNGAGGVGVIISKKSDVTIINCNIREGKILRSSDTPGIHISSSENVKILNNNIDAMLPLLILGGNGYLIKGNKLRSTHNLPEGYILFIRTPCVRVSLTKCKDKPPTNIQFVDNNMIIHSLRGISLDRGTGITFVNTNFSVPYYFSQGQQGDPEPSQTRSFANELIYIDTGRTSAKFTNTRISTTEGSILFEGDFIPISSIGERNIKISRGTISIPGITGQRAYKSPPVQRGEFKRSDTVIFIEVDTDALPFLKNIPITVNLTRVPYDDMIPATGSNGFYSDCRPDCTDPVIEIRTKTQSFGTVAVTCAPGGSTGGSVSTCPSPSGSSVSITTIRSIEFSLPNGITKPTSFTTLTPVITCPEVREVSAWKTKADCRADELSFKRGGEDRETGCLFESSCITPGNVVNSRNRELNVINTVSRLTIGFISESDLPKDGSILIEVPSGFDMSKSSLFGNRCAGISGILLITTTKNTIRFIRSGPGNRFVLAGTQISCTFKRVLNPSTPGLTDSFAITIFDSEENILNQGSADGIEIKGKGTISEISFTHSSLEEGETGDITVSFKTKSPIPISGYIDITFPIEYGLLDVSLVDCRPSISGSTEFSITGQTITLKRNEDGNTVSPGRISCLITGVKNPLTAGLYSGYAVTTRSRN